MKTQKELYKPITQELKKEIDEISDLRKEFDSTNYIYATTSYNGSRKTNFGFK